MKNKFKVLPKTAINATILTTVMSIEDGLHMRRKLFWSEWSPTRILMSNMDGTEMTSLVDGGLGVVTRMVVDLPLTTLYWIDPQQHVIASVDYDTGSRRHSRHVCTSVSGHLNDRMFN